MHHADALELLVPTCATTEMEYLENTMGTLVFDILIAFNFGS